MPQPPAFQFYPGDWILGTARMSLAEKGAYIDALAHQWNADESIPDDPTELARIIRATPAEAKAVWPKVAAKFPDGRNVRLEEVRQEQANYAQKNSARGKAGARARWKHAPKQSPSNAQASANALPEAMLGDGSSTSTSSTPASKNEAGDARADAKPSAPVARRGYADPNGHRTDLSAAAHFRVGAGQLVAIPASWWLKACREYGLDLNDVDAFATWLSTWVAARGFEDQGRRLPWLDARLAEWRATRRSAAVANADIEQTDRMLAEQAAHRATAASPAAVLEGLRAGRASR